jgi:hypothetical protein
MRYSLLFGKLFESIILFSFLYVFFMYLIIKAPEIHS